MKEIEDNRYIYSISKAEESNKTRKRNELKIIFRIYLSSLRLYSRQTKIIRHVIKVKLRCNNVL